MGTIITIISPPTPSTGGIVGAVVLGNSVTGSTTNTAAGNLLIPADTIDVNKTSTLEIRGRMFKTGVAGNCTMRMYFNITPDLTGTPVLLATHTSSAANIHAQFVRQVYIDKTNTIVLAASQNANTDDIENAAGRTVIVNGGNIDYTADLYLVIAIQNGNAADSSLPTLWYTKTHGY
jgi:hypothetical protein